jgi:hypothetical protein
MKDPTLHALQNLVKENARQQTRHVVNTVNLDAMKMALVIRKVLSAFLLTHQYAAFRHTDDPLPVVLGNIETYTKKRKTSGTAYITCMNDLVTHVEGYDDNDVNMRVSTNHADNIQLSVAKSTTIIGPTWGAMSEIPNSSGLYVPFVKELAVSDTVTVPELMSTVFLRSLATSPAGMFEMLGKLRRAWGVISMTDLGHEITHLCKCIDIAIKAQAFVYPVYTNTIYEGTVICGAGFILYTRDVVYDPIPYAQLQTLVRDKSAHAKAVRTILQIIGDVGFGEAIDNCGTMRGLSRILSTVNLDVLNRREVVDAASNLSYPNKYWSTAPANVIRMLKLLQDPETPIDVTVPMHPQALFADDHVELVLCAFGHQAPTFMIPNGQTHEFANDEPPKNFHVRTISTERAVIDMRYCLERGYITNNLQNLSSKHRDTPLKGPDKVEAWKMLKALHQLQSPQAAGTKRAPPAAATGPSISDDIW